MNQLVELPKTSSELITIDPPTYVATAYEPFLARFAAAITQFGDIKYDITTTTGMEAAKAARAAFRDIRTSTEKKRAECKAPILEIGKLLDSRAKEITAQIAPHESRFDADIKAEEKRLDDEKAAKIKAEAERQSAIQAKIDSIKNMPLKAIALDSVGIQKYLIDALDGIVTSEEAFGERFVEAEIAVKTTLEQLRGMLDGKKASEELARQQEAQRIENERLARIAAEEKSAAEARQREEQEAQARILSETAAALKAGQEALARQQEELDKQKAEIDERMKVQAEAEQARKEEAAKHFTQHDSESEETARAHREAQASTLSHLPLEERPVAKPDNVVVIEHQAEISAFLASRDFGKESGKVRAILVEFVKFSEQFKSKMAA